jgi:hypothetical protein
MECEEEWWLGELGERPSLYMAMAEPESATAFVMAMMAWAERRRPGLLERPR